MKIILFAKRNSKEILRDPINLFFGLGFPLVLLFLFYVINSEMPAEANNTTNIAGWFSGVWIPLDLIGGAFKRIAEILPFYHGVEAARGAISGNFNGVLPHLAVVLGYAVVFFGLAALALRHKMGSDKV